jgi:shikimate dehydrogenase
MLYQAMTVQSYDLSWPNKDTQICMSLSARPGNFGTRFQNSLYHSLGLNYLYKSFTTKNLEDAIKGIRALNIRGCAISMPFKEAVIPMLDELDSSAAGIQSVNTVVNTNGRLKGLNTDYSALKILIAKNEISPSTPTAILGSGGMAKAAACALRDLGFRDVTILSRNEKTGAALATQYGFKFGQWNHGPFSNQMSSLQNSKHNLTQEANSSPYAFLLNVTPIGMTPDAPDSMPFSLSWISTCQYILDSVAQPLETTLIQEARAAGVQVISGFDITVLQSLEQFILYTGVTPPGGFTGELVQNAAMTARG